MAAGVMDPRVTQALSIAINKLNTCDPFYDTNKDTVCPLNTTQLDGRPWETDRDEHLRSHAPSVCYLFLGMYARVCTECVSPLGCLFFCTCSSMRTIASNCNETLTTINCLRTEFHLNLFLKFFLKFIFFISA